MVIKIMIAQVGRVKFPNFWADSGRNRAGSFTYTLKTYKSPCALYQLYVSRRLV
jgi:hypothetical protein